MFTKGIANAREWTRSINCITRAYKVDQPQPISHTLFFVNEDGVAITTKSALEFVLSSKVLQERYAEFKDKKAGNANVAKLEQEMGFLPGKIMEIRTSFAHFIQGNFNFDYIKHPTVDLAIIKFRDFTHMNVNSYCKFSNKKGALPQGKLLAMIGFPFPEFNNFKYNKDEDKLEWLPTGNLITPMYPEMGLLTRNVASQEAGQFGFELSCSGYNGMGGAPVIDEKGVVYGMHFSNMIVPNSYPSIPYNVIINGQKQVIATSPISLHAHAISAEVITNFLKENDIKFYEEDLYDMEVC